MTKFILPIYWTQIFKTKPDKTTLNGLNFYRNAHYHTLNVMKAELEELVINQTKGVGPILGPYKVRYDLYYKSPVCDGSNIFAVIEKIFLDGLQRSGLVHEDNVKHHLGSTWNVIAQDKENPRFEIFITDID